MKVRAEAGTEGHDVPVGTRCGRERALQCVIRHGHNIALVLVVEVGRVPGGRLTFFDLTGPSTIKVYRILRTD